MAEVKLYIYKGSEKGDAVSLGKGGIYSFDKSTILPPKKDTDTETGVVTLSSKTITSTYHVALPSLTKLTYLKKVYEPCEIHAEIQVGSVQMKTTKVTKIITFDKQGKELSSSETKEEGKFTEVENDPAKKLKGATYSGKDLSTSFTGAKVILEIDGNTVAENYMVFKVRTIHKTISNSTSQFLELTIYSADKMMDLDKYSRAYTAKKLYTDILAEESKKFNLKDADKEEDCTSLSTLIVNHMQMLKYKAGVMEGTTEKSTWTETDELRIPYIVQYNESFYEFMKRTANRFGEFLYFEDGKLNLGMQPSDANYYKRDTNGGIAQKDGKDVIIDWVTEPNAVESLYYESVLSEGISVDDCAYSYNDHEHSNGVAYATSADKRYNIDSVPADVWTTHELHNQSYTTQSDLWQEELQTHIVGFVFRCLKQTSLSQFIINLITDTAKKSYDIAMFRNSFNNTMQEENYDGIKDHEDQVSGDYFNQFATYDGSNHLSSNLKILGTSNDIVNFTNLFYPLIRKKEKEIEEQAVWLEFGEHYKPIKLGDKLRINDRDYVAIHVEGSYIENVEKMSVKAIPVYELDSLEAEPSDTDRTSTNDAWSTTLPVPPALTDVLIRDARPQVAFVTQITDPDSLGRIRVRYPWQDSKGDPTPWIRVTLPLATSGGAVNFSPSIGDEVMVGYEHGNIDHPYAMGYLTAPFVNNEWADSIPFDHWGGQHGIKVKTGHHLTFTDGANGASFLANLFGPLSIFSSLWPIGAWPLENVHMRDLAGGFELSDRYGFYKISGNTEEREISIESPMGTVEMSAFQGITISAPNGDINITGKNVTISANNKLNISSGNTVKDHFYYQKEWKDSKLKAIGMSLLPGAIEGFKSIGVVEKLYDMSFLRCVLDVLLRPVDGTLQIKSYTFVRIEAGEGTTEYPRVSFRKDNQKSDNLLKAFNKVYLTVQVIQQTISARLDEIKEKYNTVGEKMKAFKDISGDKGINKNSSAITYDKVIKKGKDSLKLEDFKWDSDVKGNNLKRYDGEFTEQKPDRTEEKYKKLSDDEFRKVCDEYFTRLNAHHTNLTYNTVRSIAQKAILATCEDLRNAAYELQEVAKKWTNMGDNDLVKNNIADTDIDVTDIKKFISETTLIDKNSIKPLKDLVSLSYDDMIVSLGQDVWDYQKSALTRFIVWKYLQSKKNEISQGKDSFSSATETTNGDKWENYAESIDANDLTGLKKHINRALKVVNHEWFPTSGLYSGIWEDAFKWKYSSKGRILMSDRENKTIFFDDNLSLKTETNREFYEENIKALKSLLKKM